jgi:hypothetical protein
MPTPGGKTVLTYTHVLPKFGAQNFFRHAWKANDVIFWKARILKGRMSSLWLVNKCRCKIKIYYLFHIRPHLLNTLSVDLFG